MSPCFSWPPSLDHKKVTATDFSFSEETLTSAGKVYHFEKVGDSTVLDSILDRGDPALTGYIDLLVQLNAGFSVNKEGEITEISFINCSAEEIDIHLLEKLPSLRRIYLAENSQPVPKSERIDIGLKDLSGDREWKAKNSRSTSKSASKNLETGSLPALHQQMGT